MTSAFEHFLDRNPANHQPLSPIGLLERAARIYPRHTAVIHGQSFRLTYAQFWDRSRQLAAAISARGLGRNDTVSVLLSNTPPMLEAHYGVPMAGAVLHSINTRLDPAIVAFQLDHAESKLLIVDREFSELAREALAHAQVDPIVITYDDPEYPDDAPYPKGPVMGMDYEDFLNTGTPDFDWIRPTDEWDAIALNYTSGTTGNPKGAVYHHRGAALMAYANTIHAGLGQHPVYLWTLPMFHCNGWCFPWTLAIQAGTHVCLRWVRARPMYDAIADHGVTHLCGAPIVMSTLVNAQPEDRRALPSGVVFNVAGAPPPESVIAAMGAAGFTVNHLYGLTETYGPAVVNQWHDEWDALPDADRTEKKARQGVRYAALDDLTVLDPETMLPVPADGTTLGEVMFRGNIVMKGYLKNPHASEEAFAGGWFHSGDLGVMHPDGYIQLKDRSKDIIISGGENISSIEVENVLYSHPAVMICAVIAHASEKWGETPVAYVELKPEESATEAEILDWCRRHLARFKCPSAVIFTEIPRTSTGKVQKFRLRDLARQAPAA